MSNLPLSPLPAGFPSVTLTPCPTPPSSVFSRLSQPKTVAKQLEEAAVVVLPPNLTIEDLPKITWKNRRFVQEDPLARKGAKGRKSWIRSHGTFLVELNYQDQPIGHVWCCNRCDMKGAAEFFSVQATSSAADHLRKHSSPDHPSQPVYGENLAGSLVDIVYEWEIEGRVGCPISDNMAANDTCLYHMYQQLDPSMRRVDIKARRMRCHGHTLNLVVCAFLFGKDAESFELESDINSMRGLIEQDLDHWRTKGLIGKLCNIVKFIRSSPQRSEQFKRIAREQDYEGYRLCEESTAELEEEENEAKRIPANDMLSSEDWRVLGEVNEVLKPIYLQTMRTQGWGKGDGHGRLWEVLIGMEYLLEHFEDWKVFYSEVTVEPMSEAHMDAVERNVTASVNLRESNGRPSRVRRLPARFDEDEIYALPQRSQPPRFAESALPPHSRAEFSTVEKRSASEMSQKSTLPADHRAYIRASINNGWKKLNEYYDKLGESPLFAAAIILHPRFGISSLEVTWVSEEQLAWVRDAKVGSKDYFTRWYDANQGLCGETMKYNVAPRTMGQEDDQYT
ncbi:hypothetical protein BFJ63_vAg18517 [Fusarium oxysporum f. sp. narcissi]|uniref:AC transposase n=1 Tax=Fusarium oxysporum f. sp. narcissi TaxID=451672 RepID=A0A4Q2V1G9_FUSOX|nr:hypothetical protein BFJ63_vAg18517 [Fusarium oxysporum f. sp. narcissi]